MPSDKSSAEFIYLIRLPAVVGIAVLLFAYLLNYVKMNITLNLEPLNIRMSVIVDLVSQLYACNEFLFISLKKSLDT